MAQAVYLADSYDILAQRYRKQCGELDLVVRKFGWLVFVEVKTRRGNRCGSAAEGVTVWKLRRMRQTAREYLQEFTQYKGMQYRFDVVAVDFEPDMNLCRVEVIKGVG